MIGDVDRQQSSRTWLAIRSPALPAIGSWETAGHDHVVRPPKGTTHVVLDTPAGLHGKRLDEVMKLADKVIVPLQPSIFDIHATHAFLKELLAHRRSDKVDIAIVGMRTREGTISAEQLRDFLGGLKVPVLGYLRDTQNYVHLAARGMSLWDVAGQRFERDLEQWQPIVEWLEK
jgi:chromosome partitioning protein